MNFPCSPCACIGFHRVLQFSLAVQRHAHLSVFLSLYICPELEWQSARIGLDRLGCRTLTCILKLLYCYFHLLHISIPYSFSITCTAKTAWNTQASFNAIWKNFQNFYFLTTAVLFREQQSYEGWGEGTTHKNHYSSKIIGHIVVKQCYFIPNVAVQKPLLLLSLFY